MKDTEAKEKGKITYIGNTYYVYRYLVRSYYTRDIEKNFVYILVYIKDSKVKKKKREINYIENIYTFVKNKKAEKERKKSISPILEIFIRL